MQYHIKNEHQRNVAIGDLSEIDLPATMTLGKYKKNRSAEQNALSHVWYAQVAARLRDDTAAGVKGYCKLHFGIPILRTDIEFSEMYDSTIKTLNYEQKLKIMEFPDMFPVTSLMKTDQLSMYLDQIQHHYAGRGVELRFPDEPPL